DSRLDDLIHNKTEFEVQAASLPPRLILFGRPGGPVKLRIDAAHHEVPAPHMNVSGERRPSAASRAAVSASESQPRKRAEGTGAGLDRALNYLHGREES
ncbi:MAG: hypothetical protein KDA96_02455, partial [Planctomycetaceae bacterium]|nr:hypothetical protein [Planctomycetaceae bacterium]